MGPLVDALGALDVDAARGLTRRSTPVTPPRSTARLLGLLRDGQRWVWVIEDAHWADGATLDLLRFLARRIASLPVLLVVSYREDEVGPALTRLRWRWAMWRASRRCTALG